MNLKKKIGKVLTGTSVGTGPSSYAKKNLPGRGLIKVEKHWFTRRPMYVYDISLNPVRMRNVSDRNCRESPHTHFVK